MKPQTGFAVLLFLFCSFAVQPEKLRCHKTLTAEELNEDFNILVTTLQEAHPDLYRVNSKTVFDAEIAKIRAELKTGKTYLEFLRLIAPLFTTIGDINVQWSHAKDFIDYRNKNIALFPVLFHIDSGRFITDSYGLEVPQHSEILSINGVAMSNYLALNRPLLPIDGKITTVQDRWLEEYFAKHHANFWEQPDSFQVQYSNPHFGENTVWVKPSEYDMVLGSVTYEKGVKIKGDVAILTWPECWPNSLSRNSDQLKADFLEIKNSACKKLIIDMHGQFSQEATGMEYGQNLFSFLIDKPQQYLVDYKTRDTSRFTFRKHMLKIPAQAAKIGTGKVQPAPDNFTGEVYILADGWTNQARGFFCAALQNRPNTFYAGEECGASTFGTNCCPLQLLLPNSGISVSIPTAQYLLDKKDYKSVHGPVVTMPVKMHLHNPAGELRSIITH